MYDGSIGRWFQEDPIDIDAGDANLYRYCGNDPMNFTDPDGLQGRALRQTYEHQLLQPPKFKGDKEAIGYEKFFLNILMPEVNLPAGAWNFLQVNKIETTVVTFKDNQFKAETFESYIVDWNRRRTAFADELGGPGFPPRLAGDAVLVFSVVTKSARILSAGQDQAIGKLLPEAFNMKQGGALYGVEKATAEKVLAQAEPPLPNKPAKLDFDYCYVWWKPSASNGAANFIPQVRAALPMATAPQLAQYEKWAGQPLGNDDIQWIYGRYLPERKDFFKANLQGK